MTYYTPDEITEDYIDHICEELKCAITDLLDNGSNDEDYDRCSMLLGHIGAMLDDMMDDDLFHPEEADTEEQGDNRDK